MRLLTVTALFTLILGILLGSFAIQNRKEKISHLPRAGGTCASLGGRCGQANDLLVCAHSGGENLGTSDCPAISGFGFCCSRDFSLPEKYPTSMPLVLLPTTWQGLLPVPTETEVSQAPTPASISFSLIQFAKDHYNQIIALTPGTNPRIINALLFSYLLSLYDPTR